MVCSLASVALQTAAHAAPPSSNGCPDESLKAEDLVASRARQPEGASQSGTNWIPLDAITLRTAAQRRDFMLHDIRQHVAARQSTFDLSELDRVLGVMHSIKREKFLPAAQKKAAYLPLSLDIGFCQTLSNAYIIAVMTAAAHVGPDSNVLDVGTGSGYQAAILSRLARHVQSIEIVPQLALQASRRLKRMGYSNVDVVAADGYAGWSKLAPFDAIIVTAGSTQIPQPLLDQLKPGGRLIMPVGPTAIEEEIVLASKSTTGVVTRCTMGLAAFVPMTGRAQGLAEESAGQVPSTVSRLPKCYSAAVT